MCLNKKLIAVARFSMSSALSSKINNRNPPRTAYMNKVPADPISKLHVVSQVTHCSRIIYAVHRPDQRVALSGTGPEPLQGLPVAESMVNEMGRGIQYNLCLMFVKKLRAYEILPYIFIS